MTQDGGKYRQPTARLKPSRVLHTSLKTVSAAQILFSLYSIGCALGLVFLDNEKSIKNLFQNWFFLKHVSWASTLFAGAAALLSGATLARLLCGLPYFFRGRILCHLSSAIFASAALMAHLIVHGWRTGIQLLSNSSGTGDERVLIGTEAVLENGGERSPEILTASATTIDVGPAVESPAVLFAGFISPTSLAAAVDVTALVVALLNFFCCSFSASVMISLIGQLNGRRNSANRLSHMTNEIQSDPGSSGIYDSIDPSSDPKESLVVVPSILLDHGIHSVAGPGQIAQHKLNNSSSSSELITTSAPAAANNTADTMKSKNTGPSMENKGSTTVNMKSEGLGFKPRVKPPFSRAKIPLSPRTTSLLYSDANQDYDNDDGYESTPLQLLHRNISLQNQVNQFSSTESGFNRMETSLGDCRTTSGSILPNLQQNIGSKKQPVIPYRSGRLYSAV